MRRGESYLSRAFIVSCIYLLIIILGGFFILPGVFHVDNYHLPVAAEIFLKVTSFVAAAVVLLSALVIPVRKFTHKPVEQTSSPAVVAAFTLLGGLILIFILGLYVKLKSCPLAADGAWYCHVEGKSYVGMLVVVFFVASLAGLMAWVLQRLARSVN